MAPASFHEFKVLFEQVPDWAAALVTPVKGGNGVRFADVDVPVTHVPGVTLEATPRAKAKRTLPAINAEPLPLEAEMVERLLAFAIERDAIRLRKEAGQPPPWTTDPILSVGAFCNVHREHDRVSRWIASNWRDPHHNDPDLWFAMTVARCINEPDALAEIGYPVPFDAEHVRTVLTTRQLRGDKVFRTDAYKPPTPPEKSRSTVAFLVSDVLGPLWRDREQLRPRAGETLAAYSDRLRERYRIGPFLAGQIIADLKHVEPLHSASDWWEFAVPGPGSLRGLNRAANRPVKASWSEPVWHATLLELGAEIAPRLEAAGIARLDLQDTQGCLCEVDKYERAREKGGKPARRYAGAPRERKRSGSKLVTTPRSSGKAGEREGDESAKFSNDFDRGGKTRHVADRGGAASREQNS
jgi:alpha-glutamyl/putrescinyl thymine pyrophosphorylase clade 1